MCLNESKGTTIYLMVFYVKYNIQSIFLVFQLTDLRFLRCLLGTFEVIMCFRKLENTEVDEMGTRLFYVFIFSLNLKPLSHLYLYHLHLYSCTCIS